MSQRIRGASVLQATLDALLRPAAALDRGGSIAIANRAWSDCRFFSRPAAVGDLLLPFLAEASGETAEFAECVRRVIEGEQPETQGELFLPAPCRWVRIQASQLRGGRLPFVLVVLEDVSALRELQDKEEFYRRLVELSPIPIAVQSEGVFLFVNPAAVQIVAATGPAELLGRRSTDWVHPDYQEPLQQRNARLQKGETVPAMELRLVRPDGSEVQVEVASIPITYGGKPATLSMGLDITARKSAEERLRESEEKYRTLVESSLQGILIYQDGRIVFANRSQAETSGYSIEELTALTPAQVEELIHPEDRELVKTRIRDRIAVKPVPDHYEFRLLRKDGTVRNVEIHATVIQYEGRSAILVSQLDITERNRAREELRDSQEKLQAVVSSTPMILWAVDANGVTTLSEGKGLEALGLKSGEVVGRSVFEMYPDEPGILESHRRALAGESFHYRRRRGGIIFDLQFTPLKNRSEETVGAIGVAIDVTDLARAEEALKRSEERYRSLVEIAPHGIEECDLAGTITLANPAYHRMYGFEPGELVGRKFWDGAASESERERFQAFLAHIIDDQPPPTPDISLQVSKDGREILVQVDWNYRRDEQGRVVGFVSVITDVTERERAREEIERHAERLESLVEERSERILQLERQRAEGEKIAATGRMAARIAHEINNPLAGIKNSFLLVKGAVPGDHPYYPYVILIEKEINRIGLIVRQMFDLYRPEPDRPRKFLLCESLQDIIELLQPGAREREVALDAEGGAFAVRLPEASLRQALLSLVQNAIEASAPGGKVLIGARLDDGRLMLSVADHGAGISEEIAPQIFEPFFTTKVHEATGGLGLGLSISKSLVEAMGGTLGFRSETGRETVFTMTIPVIPP